VTGALGRTCRGRSALPIERGRPVRAPDRERRGLVGASHRLLVALFLYILASPFFYGGILHILAHPGERAGRFAQTFAPARAAIMGDFFRLIPASLVLWVPAAALFLLADRALDFPPAAIRS